MAPTPIRECAWHGWLMGRSPGKGRLMGCCAVRSGEKGGMGMAFQGLVSGHEYYQLYVHHWAYVDRFDGEGQLLHAVRCLLAVGLVFDVRIVDSVVMRIVGNGTYQKGMTPNGVAFVVLGEEGRCQGL